MSSDKTKILSFADCKSIITNYLHSDDFQVLAYEVLQFTDEVNGFTRTYFSIKIKIASDGLEREVRFFAKRFPFEHEFHWKYALSADACANEICTYSVLFDEFKKVDGFDTEFAPKFYFGKDNDIIVLEDLSAKGFCTVQELSLAHIKLALKALAKYHSGSIGYQEIKSRELGKKYRLIEEYPGCMQEPLFRRDETFLGYGWVKGRLSAIKAIIDEGPFQEEFKRKVEKLAYECFDILQPKDDLYNTLCHGDMCGKNVMFRYENGLPIEAKLIDFQLQRFAPPAHDVLHFIFLNTSTATRKCHLHSLLRHYHSCLKSELSKAQLDLATILSYGDFEVSVNYLLPQIKLQTAYYCSFLAANPEFYKRLTRNVNDLRKFVFDDGAPFCVELFNNNENYRKSMMEVLTELKVFVTHAKITQEDCFKIVHSKLGIVSYDLLDFSLEGLEKIGGFLGDHYKLKIDVGIGGRRETLRLFAKCASANKTSYEMAIGSRAFIKEAFVLNTLFPLIQKNGINIIDECLVPCHLIRINDVIIFDDLEFSGYVVGNQRAPSNLELLKVVIKKLATYHATNIILEEKISKQTSRTFRLLDHFKSELEESFFPTNGHQQSSLSIKLGIDTVEHQIDLFSPWENQSQFKSRVQKAFERVYELVKPSNKFRNVICHGDLWASNLMIKYQDKKPIDCRIIDYQILRYCPPAHDLLNLIYLTTDRKTRANSIRELIYFYYEEFGKVLKMYDCKVEEIYTREEFLESCDVMTPQAVCQTVLYYHFIMTDSALMQKYIADEEMTKKVFLEDRKNFITEMCSKDPIYKERMRESIEDLYEMCFKYY